jgi:hypothetical protein
MVYTRKSDHPWFKRPELFVPQWVMGYAIETQRVSRWSWKQHEHLRTWHDTEEPPFQIISIDVDHILVEDDEVQSFQIGISILDTEPLGDVLTQPPEPDANLAARVVQSHHWVVGDEGYPPEYESQFIFGRMRYVPMDEFETNIMDVIQASNFFLITHGENKALPFLKSRGIHLQPLNIIDTAQAAQEVLRLLTSQTMSKDEVARGIGVPCEAPDLAGNDAHLSLRILLMLIAEDVDRHLHRKDVPMDQWALILKRIVNSPPKKRKLRRMRRSPSTDSTQQSSGQGDNETSSTTCIQASSPPSTEQSGGQSDNEVSPANRTPASPPSSIG